NKKINDVAVAGANLIHKDVTQNFNAKVITAAKDKTPPLLAIDPAAISSAITASVTSYQSSDTAMAQQALFDILLQETIFTGLDTAPKKTALKAKIDAYNGLSAASLLLAKNVVDGIQSSTQGNANSANIVVVAEAP